MADHPILFSAPMVRAILSGAKTQTRRVFKLPRGHSWDTQFGGEAKGQTTADRWPGGWHVSELRCPYGRPGDLLWVRETFARIDGQTRPWIETDYRATYTHGDRLGDTLGIKKRWTPSIHMPRHASRITLAITSVRVERLQNISEADALAEGIVDTSGGFGLPDGSHFHTTDPRISYWSLWEHINGPGSADADPWVWAVTFERITP